MQSHKLNSRDAISGSPKSVWGALRSLGIRFLVVFIVSSEAQSSGCCLRGFDVAHQAFMLLRVPDRDPQRHGNSLIGVAVPK